MDVPWDIFWESEPYKGKVGLLDDKRDALCDADAARRDATRRGRRPQHGGPDDRRQGRRGPPAADRHLQHQGDDHRLPDAARGEDRGSTTRGRATSSRGAFYYLPKGTPPDVLSFWGPGRGGVVQNDFLCITRAARRSLRSRTPSSTSCSTRRTRTTTSSTSTATCRRRGRSTAEALIEERADPEDARGRRHRGPSSSRSTRRCSRSPSRASGAGSRPGRSSRPAKERVEGRWIWRGLALPGRRLALALLPRRVLRGALRRLRQHEHAQRAGAVLEPARLERRLRARDAPRTSGTAGSS